MSKETTLDIGRGETLLLPHRETLIGGLKIEQKFSKATIHPYDEFAWEKKNVMIYDFSKKKASFSRDNVEVPSHWAENAIRITASKYLFGSTPETPEYEDSLRHPFDRIANTYTIWGWKNGYFATLEDTKTFNWEIKAMLVGQIWAPNSPVWFNLGHWEQYRWNRPDLREKLTGKGNKAFKAFKKGDGIVVEKFDNVYIRPQSSACFLTEIEDSMESILHHQIAEGRIFASGSGAGMNLSNMRSSYEPIAGRGRSSGPISFDKGWDRMAGAIKSGGRSRRAARMCLLNSDHPDIFDWVNLKNSQEEIAKVILREHNTHIELKKLAEEKLKSKNPAEQIAASFILALPLVNEKTYAGDMDGEIYGETVSNQNANHSVSLKGDFWKAYYANGDYSTRWVTKPDKIHATFRAKDLLEAMAKSVWANAEPGSHNSDFINLWNPVKSIGRITTSNPCCFVGSTLVGTEAGPYSFKYLAEEGKDVDVYCQDPATGRTHIRKMWGIEVKRKNVPITKVTFEDGSFVRCTHDERFLDLDGEYVEAQDCKPGQKLRPFLLQCPKDGPTIGSSILTGYDPEIQHREVIKVEADGTEDVYDGTVDEFHNFAVITSSHCEDPGCLHMGFFAHNSEYFHLTGTSCNLSSLNVFRFLENGVINTGKLAHGALLAMICADLNIEECGFPIPEIAEGTYLYRSTGVGFGNIGGLLMALGIPYDSDEGRYIAGLLMSHLTASCWKASATMGKEFGPYLKYDETKKDLHEVLRLHQACHDLLVEMPKLNGNAEKTEEVITSLANTFKPLPVSDNLTGTDAMRSLVASFQNNGEWDAAWLKVAAGLVEADPWDGLGDESIPLRNSFVSLEAPGGCLVENSMVLTGRGLRRIKRMGNPNGAKWQDIQTEVQTDEGPKQATKFFVNGKAKTRIIKTDCLLELSGTWKHQIKKLNPTTLELEWVRMDAVQKGDIAAARLGGMFGLAKTVWLPNLPAMHGNNKAEVKVPTVMTKELAEFLGLFCGGGSLHSKSVRICCANEDPDLIQYILKLGMTLFNINGEVCPKEIGNQSVSVDFVSTPLTNWFAACGFQKHTNRNGGMSEKPYIPDAVLETNDPYTYGAFLRGLFETDGTFQIGSLPCLRNHHQPFLQDVMVMMLALGIAPSMDDTYTSGMSGKTLYMVRVRNQDYLGKWKKYCGFLSKRKIERQNVREASPFSKNDYIPVSPDWLHNAKVETRRNQSLGCALRNGRVTKNAARKIIKTEAGSELGRKLANLLDYVFDPVWENLEGPTVETFDLSVPENVTYIANGFVSHNTISAPLGIYDEGTTSAEPDYALVKYKTLSGGGTITMFNTLALKGLKTLGYTEFQVREAALEVAGLNGLIIACNGDITAAANHIGKKVDEDQTGPVRDLFENTPRPAGENLGELIASLAYGKPTDLPALVTNGKGHVEAIPWLSEHHKAVFDCASTSQDGTRSIAAAGHIRMLGALQPFVSGATSKCVTAETVITTSKGLKRIGGLYNDEKPDSFRDIDFDVPAPKGTAKAAQFYYGGTRPVYRVELEDGRIIRGTDVHRLRTAEETGLDWKNLPELETGDWVALQLGAEMWGQENVPQNIVLSEIPGSQNAFRCPTQEQAVYVALFLGMLAADGHITRTNYSIHLTKNCDEVRNQFRWLLLNLFGLEGHDKTDPRNGVRFVSVGSKSLMEWLDAVHFSKTNIPDFILEGSREMAVAWLSGIFLNGWIEPENKDIKIGQKHQSLTRDAQCILDNLGVATYFTDNIVDGVNYPVLNILRRDRNKAAHLLTWLEPHKAALAKEPIEAEDKTVFPMHRLELQTLLLEQHKTQEFRNVMDARTKTIMRTTFLKAAKTTGFTIPEEELAYQYTRVAKIQYDGEEDVFDISVPETEQFVANGIVNHNTVNLPDTATEEDILRCFEDSHKMGVKCIALYRNGSKGVAVFAGDTPDSRKWKVENIWADTVLSVNKKMDEIVTTASIPKRHKLPGRRWAQTIKFEIAAQTPMEGFLIVGIYPDGRCGEVFGRLGQGGSFGHGMFESFCKSFSGMLQWGVPLDKAISMFRSTAFDPSGWTSVYDPDSEGGKTDIKSCRSVVDLMMQILAWMFPEERGNRIRSIESNQIVMDNASVTFEPREEDKVEIKPKKVDFSAAEQCPQCHALAYIQDGKCKKCRNCDYSGGGCG